ncbi:MAG: radical SAM protein [Acidobacteria bacterium]|nr:radical SAM protein [Acidobacteriota bacterium]
MELGWRYLTDGDKEQIIRGVADGVAYGGPYHVEIHPADRCNIDCFFCSTASIRGTDELPRDQYEKLFAELKSLGTRSIRLSGGGEPLFHREIRTFLRAVSESGIPIENLTTNGVLLDETVMRLLIEARCEQITVSLNTGDPKSYAMMMQTPERLFDRVLRNIRALLAERRSKNLRGPLVNLQFLVWKQNYRTIPQMYELARELNVDSIIFSGLSHLGAEQKMSPAETDEMMALYEEIVRVDELRRISSIESLEQDLTPRVEDMTARLAAERNGRGLIAKAAAFIGRDDFTFAEKASHWLKMRRNAKVDAQLAMLEEQCIISWHSMVIRTIGTVAPCCILQHVPLGNIYATSVRDVWFGERFVKLRGELSRIIREGDAWQSDPTQDEIVLPMCGGRGTDACPIRTFYFRRDLGFRQSLSERIRESRG